jgi:drug/metabolite transporter (DMT)-like permease
MVNWILLITLNVLSFAFVAIQPVLHKKLYAAVPFPLLATGVQMSISAPLSLLPAWVAAGFPHSMSWLRPPSDIFWLVAVASFSHGCMILTHNLGIFVSDLDFTILFRLFGIALQGFLAQLILHEQISPQAGISICFVISGGFLLEFKGTWSTEKMSSLGQAVLQLFAILFFSIGQIAMKKAMNILKSKPNGPHVLTILPFRYLICQIPIYIAAWAFEGRHWQHFVSSFDAKALKIGVVGVFTGLGAQITMIMLSNLLTVVANAICGQLKVIPALLASNLLHSKGEWTLQRMGGTGLLLMGSFMFAASRLRGDVKSDEVQAEVAETTVFSAGSQIGGSPPFKVADENPSSDFLNTRPAPGM